MDDVNREKLDAEISRVHDKLKVLSPDSEEYDKVCKKLVDLTDLANRDDEARNKYEIDKEKLDAEASLEASKRGMESEKLDAEARIRDQDVKRSWIQFGISAGVTVFTFVGTWIANRISQNQSEYFEATGHGYTSRFSKWQNKEPVHPNPLLRLKDK